MPEILVFMGDHWVLFMALGVILGLLTYNLIVGEKGSVDPTPHSSAGGDRGRGVVDVRLQPRCLHALPAGIVDGHVHVAGEDGEAVVAVIRTRVVPRVHLAEGDAHLLEDVLLLDARADEIGLDALDELLELVARDVVIEQRRVTHLFDGAIVVVVVRKLIAGADHFHAEIFVGADEPPGAGERQFALRTIYLKDLSFESPNAPAVFQGEWKPETSLHLDIKVNNLDADTHEIVLTVTVTAKAGDNTAYLVEVQQAGIVSARGFEQQEYGPLFYVYCPSILFPYARQAVTDVVGKGGFSLIYLAEDEETGDEVVIKAEQAGGGDQPATTH